MKMVPTTFSYNLNDMHFISFPERPVYLVTGKNYFDAFFIAAHRHGHQNDNNTRMHAMLCANDIVEKANY